jgi:RNA polymerase sigma-70 factor (ECF subfamily)
METSQSHLQVFELHRPHLAGLAYRMTGSLTDADDIVQDAWLRWSRIDPAAVDAPKPYLLQIVARLCVDLATSARARREVYVGSWLPEPVTDLPAIGGHPDAEQEASLADDLSIALLLVLERLSPLERAAFLLHDVFDLTFEEVAGVLDRAPAACRKLASRARRRVAEGRPEVKPSRSAANAFIEKFQHALTTGDVASLAKMLAEDAKLIADGGGKVYAALNPIEGRDRIIRFLTGLLTKFGAPKEIRRLLLNGGDGLLIIEGDGGLQTWSIDWNANGEAQTIYAVRNPDKLRRLAPVEGSLPQTSGFRARASRAPE